MISPRYAFVYEQPNHKGVALLPFYNRVIDAVNDNVGTVRMMKRTGEGACCVLDLETNEAFRLNEDSYQ
ncbi:MAG: hypothetical protein ACRDFB_05235 [Rhabdochlamydiaceae bacterium]